MAELHNRRDPVIDPEARSVFSPEDLLTHPARHAVPDRLADGTLLRAVSGTVGARVVDMIEAVQADQFITLIAKHKQCCLIDKENLALPVQAEDPLRNGVQNEPALILEACGQESLSSGSKACGLLGRTASG
ncbi:hypothetical protein D3C75_250930 [compost metagenome]